MIDRSDPWYFDGQATAEDRRAVAVGRFGPVLPLDQQIGVWPKQSVPDALMKPLFSPPDEMCFALLEGARIPNLQEILEHSGLPHQCLFRGEARDTLGEVAPWLVALTPDAALTREIFTQGRFAWLEGEMHAAVFFRTKAPLDLLYRHLRRFVKLPDEDDHWAFFRFWDPTVLGGYLEAQTHEGMGDLCQALLTLEGYGLTAVLEGREGIWMQIAGYISGPRGRLKLSARDREQLSRPVRNKYADLLVRECSRRILGVSAPVPPDTREVCHKVADFVYLHGGRGSATVRQGIALAMMLLMMDRAAGDVVLAGPVMRNSDLTLGERIDMTVNSFITAVNQVAEGRH